MKAIRWAVVVGSMITLPFVVTLILRVFRHSPSDLRYDTTDYVS